MAPIVSGGHVAALVYADNLPDDAPLGDTAAFDGLLREVGRALDQTLLERSGGGG